MRPEVRFKSVKSDYFNLRGIMEYTCHSGGCPGSDMVWENEAYKYNIKTIAYSFPGHVQYSKNQNILSAEEINEGLEHVLIAEKSLNRNLKNLTSGYVLNLLCRNWFQVKNSDAVFAIGFFTTSEHTFVSGGTGWAIQMSIDNKKDTFLFNQDSNIWNKYNYETERFDEINYIPELTTNFAGVGTRQISMMGETAIREIFKYNF